MAQTVKTAEASEQVQAQARRFPKTEILKAERYRGRQDMIHALLQEGVSYTLKEVDEMISCFLKGKVK